MSSLFPPGKARPKRSHLECLNILGAYGCDSPLALVFERGYYEKTMGDPAKNDRKIFDDFGAIVGADVYAAFNANVDPNGYRAGHGSGGSKGMASLKPGLYSKTWRLGLHKGQYEALVQRGPLTVYRDADSSVPKQKTFLLDGRPVYEETGDHQGINIHKAGAKDLSTSSLGCLTIPQSQYASWMGMLKPLMKRYGLTFVPVLLLP